MESEARWSSARGDESQCAKTGTDSGQAAVHTSTHSRIFCDHGRTHAQARTSSALWGCRLPNIAASNEFKFCPPHFPNSAGSPSAPVGARQQAFFHTLRCQPHPASAPRTFVHQFVLAVGTGLDVLELADRLAVLNRVLHGTGTPIILHVQPLIAARACTHSHLAASRDTPHTGACSTRK